MKKITLITFLINCCLIAFSQQATKSKFQLNGKISNSNSDIIILSYLDYNGKYIIDTANIVNGKFYFEGSVNAPTLASLTVNINSPSVSDPNFADFFLEPNQLEIEIEEGNFKNLKVKGSKTQDEISILKNLQKPINDKLAILNPVFTQVRKEYIKQNKPDSLSKKLDAVKAEIISLSKQLIPFEANFVEQNPQSYASAYLIFRHIDDWSIDSSSTYYANLIPQVQSSLFGNLVNQSINSNKNSAVGKEAPLFKLKDINDHEISLADFKDKSYVLLDFWASWCIPCRESTPAIKEIYKKYHNKGLEIIGVSIDDNEKFWRAAVLKDELTWLNVIVGSKLNPESLKTLYNVTPVPTYVLIGKNGVIIGKYEGTGEDLNNGLLNQIEKLFNN